MGYYSIRIKSGGVVLESKRHAEGWVLAGLRNICDTELHPLVVQIPLEWTEHLSAESRTSKLFIRMCTNSKYTF